MLLFNIILATLFISLISFVGAIVFFKKKYSQKMMEATISLAAAVLLGNVFFHLLPEIFNQSAENPSTDFNTLSIWILGSIVFFFFTEKYLHWHNCHHHQDHEKGNYIHPMGINILVGDGIHNFIDGVVIATSFMLDFNLGLMTTFAIALHEIPQEIGDFSLLLHSGFTKARALLWNFISALTSVLGAVLTYYFVQTVNNELILSSIAVGSFLYIAMSDIMPHLHDDKNKYYFIQTIWFIIGLLIIYFSNTLISFGAH